MDAAGRVWRVDVPPRRCACRASQSRGLRSFVQGVCSVPAFSFFFFSLKKIPKFLK